jgi:hypothetical protein
MRWREKPSGLRSARKAVEVRVGTADSNTAYHSRLTPIASAMSSCVTRFPTRAGGRVWAETAYVRIDLAEGT